ncbi:MAG: penicillin-binding protein 2 [Candidatus Pelagibacter sp.]|nr:penicillin-binding protein 2 [Candidatus Pelagibacter sp.]|tara:strand:- start:7183 stop:9117 length:1935 start_codon:yes stop_codon:yes gene_type:complete
MIRSGGESKIRLIGRRMFILSAAKAIVVFGIVGRLISLQINESKKYKTLSDKNRFREWKLSPPRGLINDYFGKQMASNKQVYQLHIVPENSENIQILLFRIKNILNLTDKEVFRINRKISTQKPWDPVVISDNLTWSEFSRINLFLHELQGAEPIVSVARIYTEHSSAHIIGYVSKASKKDLQKKEYLKNKIATGTRVGKTGLENKLDSEVIGDVGFKRYEVNAYGKRIREISIDLGKAGKNFRTTLDLEVQEFSSELLEGKSGSICVMDIYKGDIITMVSSPIFDPNKFVHGIDKKNWNFLIKHRDKPLINKSISGLYPPGSTIKTIAALSALENDIFNPKKEIYCKGSMELYGEKFHCWKKKGHGFMNMREGIKQSCDIYFYELARKLGIDRLSETAKKFGLGEPVLNGFIEEKKGVVPNTTWKKRVIGKNWYLGETLHAGIGQGYWQSSPLQLCLMTAQVANGGYKIKPRIILNDSDENQFKDLNQFINDRKTFSDDVVNLYDFISRYKYKSLFRNPENIKFVQDALFGATNEPGGTSYGSRLSKKEFVFAGKTGTSQVKRFTERQRELEVKNEDLPYKDRDHALFVAFAPYKDPRYAISVVIEHGGSGSKSAAPIAKKVIKKVLDRHTLRESYLGPGDTA